MCLKRQDMYVDSYLINMVRACVVISWVMYFSRWFSFLSAISSRFYRFVFSLFFAVILKLPNVSFINLLYHWEFVQLPHAVTLSRCHIVTMSHCHAVTLPRCHIVTLSWNSCEQCFLELMFNLDLIVNIVHIEIALMDWKSFQSCFIFLCGASLFSTQWMDDEYLQQNQTVDLFTTCRFSL